MLLDPALSSPVSPGCSEHRLSRGRLARETLAVAGHCRTSGRRSWRRCWRCCGLPARTNHDECADHPIHLVISGITDELERADLCRRKCHDRRVARIDIRVEDAIYLITTQLPGIIVGLLVRHVGDWY